MKRKLIIGIAAALAIPVAAIADDKPKASSGSSSADGGAEAMFKALDKNNDGFVSKDEAQGTPHSKDFSKLDKNNDGKLSRQEHASAPEHSGKSSSSGASSSGTSSAPSSSSGTSGKPKY